MTTAHKPTWTAARGRADGGYAQNPSQSYSSKDIPSHTTLKYRTSAQGAKEELDRRDLKAELEDRERAHLREVKRGRGETEDVPMIENSDEKRRKFSDESDEEEGVERDQAAYSRPPASNYKDLDADDSSGSSSDDMSDDSDDEDETAELERELEKIRRERKEEQERREQERREAEMENAARAVMHGNPLIKHGEASGDFVVKKKWYEDTVFKNQAANEPTYKKRFVNDTVRNDFHRRFINKYVK